MYHELSSLHTISAQLKVLRKCTLNLRVLSAMHSATLSRLTDSLMRTILARSIHLKIVYRLCDWRARVTSSRLETLLLTYCQLVPSLRRTHAHSGRYGRKVVAGWLRTYILLHRGGFRRKVKSGAVAMDAKWLLVERVVHLLLLSCRGGRSGC